MMSDFAICIRLLLALAKQQHTRASSWKKIIIIQNKHSNMLLRWILHQYTVEETLFPSSWKVNQFSNLVVSPGKLFSTWATVAHLGESVIRFAEHESSLYKLPIKEKSFLIFAAKLTRKSSFHGKSVTRKFRNTFDGVKNFINFFS